MRSLFLVLEKEFKQLLRNKGILRTIFIAPVIQLIIMPLAADYSIKNISLSVVDHDHSTYSRSMIEKIKSSGQFRLTSNAASYAKGLDAIEADQADLVLEIPENFEKNLVRENHDKVFLAINAIEGMKANLGGAYLGNILANFNNEIRVKWMQSEKFPSVPTVVVSSMNWYNIYMDFHLFIVPGILVTLLTALGSMQAAFNIVAEKETGTIEQINVTPIRKSIFIIGKLLPFMILSTIVFSIGLLVSYLFYGIVPSGSLFTLYGALLVYLFAMLGLGLLISTYSETQQQAMSLSFFFINIFNMMSGLFTSVDSMPNWAQGIIQAFPVSHFIKIMRMVVIKGSDFSDISGHVLAMFLIGLILNSWAIINYRKTS